MGYNTVAVILNDTVGYGDDDPNLGKEIHRAVRDWSGRSYLGRDSLDMTVRGRLMGGSYGSVVSQDHADGYQVVIAHGNMGWRVDDTEYDKYLGPQALDTMKECLERNGYRVTKRRSISSPLARSGEGTEGREGS